MLIYMDSFGGFINLRKVGHQSQTVINITNCNEELEHVIASVVKHTLEKLRLFNFDFWFSNCIENLTFGLNFLTLVKFF